MSTEQRFPKEHGSIAKSSNLLRPFYITIANALATANQHTSCQQHPCKQWEQRRSMRVRHWQDTALTSTFLNVHTDDTTLTLANIDGVLCCVAGHHQMGYQIPEASRESGCFSTTHCCCCPHCPCMWSGDGKRQQRNSHLPLYMLPSPTPARPLNGRANSNWGGSERKWSFLCHPLQMPCPIISNWLMHGSER